MLSVEDINTIKNSNAGLLVRVVGTDRFSRKFDGQTFRATAVIDSICPLIQVDAESGTMAFGPAQLIIEES